MEITYLSQLSWLSLLLILGIIFSLIALRLKISEIFFLILIGFFIGQLNLISFNQNFLSGLAIFALIMILFDSSAKFRLKDVTELSTYASKLTLNFSLFIIILLTFFAHLLFSKEYFSINSLLLAGIFGSFMIGTSPEVVLSILKEKKNKIAEVMELESIINTPLNVIIPLIMLDIYLGTFETTKTLVTFSQNILTGIGTGVAFGVVLFYVIMKKKYVENISPLAVVAIALVTYTLAENIGGNGVLATTAFGVVFGKAIIKEKVYVENFVSTFTQFFKIVVFILLGLIIKIPSSNEFLIKSIILFLAYLLIRYLAVKASFYGSNIREKEKIFMTLTASKGLTTAIVAFTLSALAVQGFEPFFDLAVLFILYSIVVSTIATKFSDFFLVSKVLTLKK